MPPSSSEELVLLSHRSLRLTQPHNSLRWRDRLHPGHLVPELIHQRSAVAGRLLSYLNQLASRWPELSPAADQSTEVSDAELPMRRHQPDGAAGRVADEPTACRNGGPREFRAGFDHPDFKVRREPAGHLPTTTARRRCSGSRHPGRGTSERAQLQLSKVETIAIRRRMLTFNIVGLSRQSVRTPSV